MSFVFGNLFTESYGSDWDGFLVNRGDGLFVGLGSVACFFESLPLCEKGGRLFFEVIPGVLILF